MSDFKKAWSIAILAAGLAMCCGCAARKPCRNCVERGRIIAHYVLDNCHDLPDGRFQCKNVVFDPQQINAKERKEK